MAETIVLVPKRKVSGFVNSSDVEALTSHIVSVVTVPGASPTGETVAYWHVTKEMKVPVGTDMYR